MGRQESRSEPEPPTNKLVEYWWVDSALAAHQAKKGNPLFRKLCDGYSFLSDQMFIDGLAAEDFYVLMLPNYCAALVSWVMTARGRTLNILTTAGEMQHADEALKAIIAAAIHGGAKMIFSVGRQGWQKVVEAQGFTTKPCLAMTKVLP